MNFASNMTVMELLLFFLALVLAIDVHEFSHVLSAYWQGDQTGRSMGRLTLNPIKHLDPWGTVFMVLATMTGFGIGWGRPAPFNPYNLRFRRWGGALVAIAGPISNIIVMTIAGYALLIFGSKLVVGNLLLYFLQTLVIINASLALFNILPIMPLDGSHLLAAWLGPTHSVVIAFQRYGFFLLILLLVVGGGFLSWYISGGVRLLLHAVGLGGLL